FPLTTRAVGGSIPIGATPTRDDLIQESVTAYELSYTGTWADAGTTVGGAVYVNHVQESIELTPVAIDLDPYTAENPPPGWLLPGEVLGLMAQFGHVLPRTTLAYRNLGPTREWGVEVWADQRLSRSWSAWANYSWQADPSIREADDPFPVSELNLPPTHRFNAGTMLNGDRFLGSLSVNRTTDAFWADVLTPEYHGYSDAYTLVNGTAGVKWRNGAVTTLVRITNLLNQRIQQHVFGDILGRSVIGELRLDLD
ncbi:MAG: hypothetical protein OXG35_30150, partial [Acidobacteria bacterium]|nr:hypothetical protein [Acidobacteriota bacterium]